MGRSSFDVRMVRGWMSHMAGIFPGSFFGLPESWSKVWVAKGSLPGPIQFLSNLDPHLNIPSVK